jgi:Holliday junction resolvase
VSAANKARGSLFERDLLNYLRNEGYDAERLRLAGTRDEGDLVLKMGGLPFIIEAKNEKKMDLSGYVREAEVEARNYSLARSLGPPGANFAAVVKRRGKGIGEAYVVVPLHEWLRHIDQAPF